MYFVHPQIKLNKVIKAKLSLIKPANLGKLVGKLSFYFPEKQFVFTDMGRSAFKVIIEKFNLQNSEMLFPAYICDIFYPIFKQYNIRPVFLDIDLKTFHVQTEEILKKITPRTKAVLICHTYGLPLDIEKLRATLTLNNSNIVIIEDCAHSFFAKKNGIYAGNLGDISFFSLYKQLPSLRGGMLVCPKNWKVELPKTFFNFRDLISFLNYFWPFAFFFKKFGSEYARAHLREEKLQKIGGINRVSLNLFSDFFKEAEKSLESRKKTALWLQNELKKMGFEVQESENNVFCYISVLVPKNLAGKRDEIVQKLKKYRVFCTRIWHTPIILNPEVQKEFNLDLAEFPNTIETAGRIINFPLQNHYTEKDVGKIVNAIRKVIHEL